MSDSLRVIAEADPPWYAEGLHFACTQCGQCCTGAPGYTWLTVQEAEQIASFLGLSLQQFSDDYLRRVGERFALKERLATYDCCFLDGKRCRIYPVRPKQCRTFPWWPENLESPETWKAAAQSCEGIDETAPLVPLADIEAQQSL